MAKQWFYSHNGQTHGPFSTEEIQRRAVARLLQPDDLLWPEGDDPQRAVTAGAALDFAGLVSSPPSPLDWLADVQRMEQAAGYRPPLAAGPKPDWLEDLRRSLPESASPGGKWPRLLSCLLRPLRRFFPGGPAESPPASGAEKRKTTFG